MTRQLQNSVAILALIMTLILPLTASAQASASTQFAKEGIFGCSRNAAALSNSVGAFSATGGVYVPVADYTVELNTGTLVYQQCVLRGLVNRMRESATSAIVGQVVRFLSSGNNGKTMFQQKPEEERVLYGTDPVALHDLQNGPLNSADPSIGPIVQRAYARSYRDQTRNRNQILACPIVGGNAQQFVQTNGGTGDDGNFWTNLISLSNDACNPLGAYNQFSILVGSDIATRLGDIQDELDRGGGYYAVTQTDADGNRIIMTPSSVVETVGAQAVTSGFNQLQSANDVDQMIGALFAGLGTQSISGADGLIGLTEQIGNQPSYLAQVTAESSAGLRNAASNAAIQVLNGALQVENAYNQVMNAIGTKLTTTIAQLRGAESQCWVKVIAAVCATPLAADNTCTAVTPACTPSSGVGSGIPGIGSVGGGTVSCPSAYTLKVATSTAFSQPIITSQISPLAAQAVQNIQSSQQALTLLNGLVAAVANTSSLDAQRIALVQLDQLVAQGKLHQQAAVTTAQQQQAAITESMTQLVTDTVKAWGDSTDTNIGWCNVNNAPVIDMWIQRWKQ